jgi:hypothetical protein
MKTRMFQFTLPIAIGATGGFTLLHPISILMVDIFEQATISLPHIISGAFMGFHLAMAVFFSIIGAVIGLMFSLHSLRLRKINNELVLLLSDMRAKNASIWNRAEKNSPELSAIVKEMRPTLNKIQKLVEIITDGSAGDITARQSTLLSITKGNIDSLFYVIDYLLSKLERDSKRFISDKIMENPRNSISHLQAEQN